MGEVIYMKLFLSTDFEGTSGIVAWEQVIECRGAMNCASTKEHRRLRVAVI
jgi:D-aminopeptidase